MWKVSLVLMNLQRDYLLCGSLFSVWSKTLRFWFTLTALRRHLFYLKPADIWPQWHMTDFKTSITAFWPIKRWNKLICQLEMANLFIGVVIMYLDLSLNTTDESKSILHSVLDVFLVSTNFWRTNVIFAENSGRSVRVNQSVKLWSRH